MRTKARIMVELPILVDREGEVFVSSCPALDVFSQGDTEDQARANIIEALSAFLASCFERGVLDQVLKDCGFATSEPDAGPIGDMVSVPLPFRVERPEGSACSA